MDAELERAYNLLTQAVKAEDVFGGLCDGKRKTSVLLKEAYDELARVVDPEFYSSPDDRELAQDAKVLLERFYEKAKSRVEENIYGQKDAPRLRRTSKSFTTDKREYYLGEPIAQGTIATVFEGECVEKDEFAGRVAIKIADSSADNDLLWRERKVLSMLHEKNGAQRKHLPVLLDHFKTKDDRIGLVFRYFAESYDLWSVRENVRYKNGVGRKHMVWMLNRLLSAIGYAHSIGIVHGNIEPAHLMIRPRDHNLFVIDWCWSIVDPVHTRDRFTISTEHFSAPEVFEKGEPTPAADLYSIGKCMIHILGGNVETNEMPVSVEPELQRFLLFFVNESPLQRAQDAWQMHGQLDSLVRRLWGQKRFLALPMG